MSKRFLSLTFAGALAASSLSTAPLAFANGLELSDKLSATGFIDMSFVSTNPDVGSSSTSSGIDQIEVDFMYNLGDGVSAQVDLEYQDNGTGEEVDIEQAVLSYSVNDALSFKAGRFLSYSGWETEEPTGLFQYSGTGYAKYFYGGYQQGVSALYKTPGFDLALSVVNDLGDLEGEGGNSKNPGIEAMVAIHPVGGWTLKAFYMTDKLDGTSETTDLINVWASYAIRGFTFAAEINASENAPAAVGFAGVGAEADGYLLMANYGWDKFGLTLRYHDFQVETAAGATVEDRSAITLAPSYTVSDNLLMVFEYRSDEDNLSNAGADSIALEALLTF